MALSFSDLLSMARDPVVQVSLAGVAIVLFLSLVFAAAFLIPSGTSSGPLATVGAYARFAYACFFKPHTGDDTGSQQDALESFYKAQAKAYDATRTRLLHGREDMLNLVASHLLQKNFGSNKPIWVDIGGGTGWNIERMGQYLPVQSFFKAVYLVDFSPSLCQVAEARFKRLGWKNVTVVCQDARYFRLEDYEDDFNGSDLASQEKSMYGMQNGSGIGADVITMSYALSMIPEFYPVIDSLSSLLAIDGIVGVVDFYVQSQVDFRSKNYTGGVIDRHCNWWSRTFWRTWFEIDRVNLDGARRDYLEYRFGTKVSINTRNHFLGVRIPYYIWVGCSKSTPAMEAKLAELDAAVTESPFLAALDDRNKPILERTTSYENRSKAYECAIVNLSGKLPLPCFWYQNHHWRIYYDCRLKKYTQFKDEYIYAFTWEDSRVDARMLKVNQDDVILALTSAGCNILSFALEKPKRIHAVDLNPAQNHLLELKVAAFTALPYEDVWKLFGLGRHDNFRQLLISKLAPHLSSYAFQYWFQNGPKVFGKTQGLYYSGGSRHAINLAAMLFRLFGLSNEVKRMCEAQTLAEQKEIWERRIRGVLLNRVVSFAIVQNEQWLWKALGVPSNQRNIILRDYDARCEATGTRKQGFGRAIWEYVVNTLDPVVTHTLLSNDNHYYLLCLQGRYSEKSHADYLSEAAHAKLSHQNAFDGLRIHTDEIMEVIDRIAPDTLTIAVVMDSMDWFDPGSDEAEKQIRHLNRALKLKGRVMLRSAGLQPWYLKTFEENGFQTKCMGGRTPGTCIDRVNMYASCWICTKVKDVRPSRPQMAELEI